MRDKYILLVALSLFLITGCGLKGKDVSKGKIAVENDRDVSINYTLFVDGKIVESSIGKAPLMYRHGKKQIVPGLEKALTGLRAGDKKKVTVTPGEGYGTINPNAIKEVKRSDLPSNAKLQAGMFVEVRGMDGRKYRARIADIKKDTVIMDFNHPLADKTLVFDIEIVSID